MPRATVTLDPKTYDLKTCLGGWVKLRRMSYGELLTSNDMAFQVSVESQDGKSDPKMGVGASTTRIAEYRFKVCIVDHNLENEAGTRLEFGNAQTVHLLDPNVGQEIDNLITRLHDWERELPNSKTPSGVVSSATGDQESTTLEPSM